MAARVRVTPDPLGSDTLGASGAMSPADSGEVSDRLVLDNARRRLFEGVYDPIRIGRFVLMRELGRGAMGVVHAGYDETLDRKVAIKLLVGRRAKTDESRARLLREARAMARVTDPNVVHVYEAGEHEGDVFVAMEFVEGETLRAWLQREPSWSRIVRLFAAAGRGLAAAHRAGVIHRDFKPDNVLIGADDVVKVADFGLAGLDRVAPELDADATDERDELSLTRTGALLGTPAYMAPEQWAGTPVDARTDQFAFSVSLFEALHGALPFPARSADELAAAVARGEITLPAQRRPVPRWLQRVLERGLAVDPSARWPDMDAMIAALAADPTRRRRVALGIAAFTGVAATITGWQLVAHARALEGCEHTAAAIGDDWNDERRDAVRAALLGTGAPYAATTADKVVARLDTDARAWSNAREQVCIAAAVERTWPEAQHRGASDCFELRRAELRGLVARLVGADDILVEHAIAAADALPRPELCTDPEQLARTPEIPDDVRDRVLAAREALSRASLLLLADATDEAATALGEAREVADTTDYLPLQVSTAWLAGRLLAKQRDVAGARSTLEDAFYRAGSAGMDELAIDIATSLALIVGQELPGDAAGLAWSRIAHMWLDRLDVGEHDLRRAGAWAASGAVHGHRGDLDEACVELARAVDLYEAALGPDHPRVAATLVNLAHYETRRAAYDEALALALRALAIQEEAFGPDHPTVATTLAEIAGIHKSRGALEDAEAMARRALAIHIAAYGADHPRVAGTLNNLANIEKLRGDLDGALEHHSRALEIRLATLGPVHRDVALSIHNLALVHETRGEYDEAIAGYRRAIAIYEQALGPDHPAITDSLVGIGEIELGRNHPERAIEPLERAIVVRDRHGFDPADLAGTRFLLARALWQTDRDRPRAVALAEQARDEYRALANATEWAAADLAAIERWLAGDREGTHP